MEKQLLDLYVRFANTQAELIQEIKLTQALFERIEELKEKLKQFELK